MMCERCKAEVPGELPPDCLCGVCWLMLPVPPQWVLDALPPVEPADPAAPCPLFADGIRPRPRGTRELARSGD